MQRKHLIAFTLATIFLLLGFNMINTTRHEQSRAQQVDSKAQVGAISNSTVVSESDSSKTNSLDITAQPLGQQSKSIIDNATADIEQAQQADRQRLEQNLESAE